MYYSCITMVIIVKYFASIRDAIGKQSEEVDVKVGATTGDIWSGVSKNIKYTGKVMVAVNHEYVNMNHSIKENDEVAFFPPVTGG